MAEPPKKDVYLQLLNSLRTSVSLPAGWSELQLPAAGRNDRATGFEAGAFVNDKTKQIVMAFNGPSSSPSGAIVGHGASTTDMLIARGQAPKGYDARVSRFVAEVKKLATANGYSTDSGNIFATGSSLGGCGAQYASALRGNGFGGANFGAPGRP